ncbi:hypothetical protein AAE02nite_01480 [Adhaeribacter aerolatus]|uniref:ATP-grasp domain-containing protein n=1 Tax=Adhaeribacter aerolatus TaxID=670289 RepID=A0A512ARZ8_9BACT|nr:D-alanine--D-alanine ligase [Adhaeribacter aerolatus]GEO02484.1 hypothetical protein AAE02nite_01480 [Adhaeribacter aerolatus]
MKVGIIFGGTGNERESAYAGGRTVYDNLDKSIFEAVPIFVDSLGNFILLDWPHLYKAGIRTFYPPTEVLPASVHQMPVYIESLGNLSSAHQTEIISRVGQQIYPADFKRYFDFAFLVLPDNAAGLDSLQSVLAENNIPNSGPGALTAAISTNRLRLKQALTQLGFPVFPYRVVSNKDWEAGDQRKALFAQLQQELGLPFVIRSTSQPGTFGNTVISDNNFDLFSESLERSLGQHTVYRQKWQELDLTEQLIQISQITHIQTGIGWPVRTRNGTVLHHPEQLHKVLNRLFTETDLQRLTLYTTGREEVLAVVEAASAGVNFSCLVMREADGEPLALVPEISLRNAEELEKPLVFNPEEQSNKAQLNLAQITGIRQECQRMCQSLDFKGYVGLTGFIDDAGNIYLDAVQPTPKMLSTAPVFRQAAVIGLNPTQFLTFIIRQAVAINLKTLPDPSSAQIRLNQLDAAIQESHQQRQHKIKVGILMGGESEDADEFIASGGYIYQLLAASEKYQPVPIFRLGPAEQFRYYILPLNLLCPPKAEAIRDKILHAPEGQPDDLLEEVRTAASHLTATFAGPLLREPQFIFFEHLPNLVDAVFIALPEQEAATGELQAELEKIKVAYSGSDLSGLHLAKNMARQQDVGQQQEFAATERSLAKPADRVVAQTGSAEHWLEITGNLLTQYLPDGRLDYEIFQTSTVSDLTAVSNQEKAIEGRPGVCFLPLYNQDQNVNKFILKKVESDLKKAAQVLNTQSYAQLQVLVRIKESQEVETIIQRVNLFPVLTAMSEILQAAALHGLTPDRFIDRMLQFALERRQKKVHGHRHTEF